MATSGNISKAITSWLTLRVKWVRNSVSGLNSNVTVVAQLVTSGGDINSTVSKDIALTIDGTTYKSTCTIGIAKNATKNLFTKTVNIAHNANGTKSFALGCTLELGITLSGTYYPTTLVSGTATLDSIATKSTFTRSGTPEMGKPQTITISSQSTSYKHTLKCSFAGETGIIISGLATNSYEWTPPVSLAAKIPHATSAPCSLILETYSGSTLIGTTTVAFTLTVPSSVVPKITAFTLYEANSSLEGFGVYVNKQSKLRYSVEAEGAQGSTIKSYSVNIGNQTFTGENGRMIAALSVGAGTHTATVTVRDSRGRSATISKEYEVCAYSAPSFNDFSVKRCDKNGAENDDGTCMKVNIKVKVAPVNNKNTAVYSLAYMPPTSNTYTPLPTSLSGYSVDETIVFESPVFSLENTYKIKLTVTDYFITRTSVIELPTAKPMVDYKSNHKGMGIGAVAQLDDVLDIGYKTRLLGGILPRVADTSADLNTLLTPNFYVSVNQGAASYANIPSDLTGTFTIEVLGAGAEGQIMQRITTCNKTSPIEYIRHYYQGAWGEWICTRSDAGDTGWLDCTMLNGCTYGTELPYLKARYKNGVVYIQGQVLGIANNWQSFATLPPPIKNVITQAFRTTALYNMSNFCGIVILTNGNMAVSTNSSGTWAGEMGLNVNINFIPKV